MKAATFRNLLNLWPPLLFSGIAVRRVSEDFREIEAVLRQMPYNKSPSGAHFGGSLFAMTDPFYALMLARILGPGYTIWDKAASIDFVSPGRGTVSAVFTLDDATVDAVRAATAGGDKHLQDFSVVIRDGAGRVVATVQKTVYLRKKPTGPGRP